MFALTGIIASGSHNAEIFLLIIVDKCPENVCPFLLSPKCFE
jgi:hypothetical protein